MKNKKLFVGGILMIVSAVAVLPMLVGAAPTYPPPTGVTDANFNSVSINKTDANQLTGLEVKGRTGTYGGNTKISNDGQVYIWGLAPADTFPTALYVSGGKYTGFNMGIFKVQNNGETYIEVPTNAGWNRMAFRVQGNLGGGDFTVFNNGSITNSDVTKPVSISDTNGLKVGGPLDMYNNNITGVWDLTAEGTIKNNNVTLASNGDVDTNGYLSAVGGVYGDHVQANGVVSGAWVQSSNSVTAGTSLSAVTTISNPGLTIAANGNITDASGDVTIADNAYVTGSVTSTGTVTAQGLVATNGLMTTSYIGTSGYLFTSGNISSGGNITASNGYVGIGTGFPSAAVHIKGTGLPSSFLYLDTNSTGQDAGIRIMEAGSVKHHIYNQSSNDSLMILANGAGPAGIELTQAGNVGIGVAAPTYKLDVNGTTRVSGWFYPKAGISTSASISGGQITGRTGGSYGVSGYGTTAGGYFSDSNSTGYSYVGYGDRGIWGYGSFAGGTFSDTNSGVWADIATDTIGLKTNAAIVTQSDIRLKKDINQLNGVLDKIMDLRGVTFKWKDEARDKETNYGFIAQEVEPLFPYLVYTDTQSGNYKMVDYSKMTVVLTEAIKELNQKTEYEMEQLKEENIALKAVVCELKPMAELCTK